MEWWVKIAPQCKGADNGDQGISLISALLTFVKFAKFLKRITVEAGFSKHFLIF